MWDPGQCEDLGQCMVDSENTMGQDHSSLRGVSCEDILHHPYLFTLDTWVCLSLNVSSIIRIVSHYLINIKYCLSSYIGECWHNLSGDSLHAGLCLWWNNSTFDLLPVTAMIWVTWQCQWLEAGWTLSRLTEVTLGGPLSVTSSASIALAELMKCFLLLDGLMKETRPPYVLNLMVYWYIKSEGCFHWKMLFLASRLFRPERRGDRQCYVWTRRGNLFFLTVLFYTF